VAGHQRAGKPSSSLGASQPPPGLLPCVPPRSRPLILRRVRSPRRARSDGVPPPTHDPPHPGPTAPRPRLPTIAGGPRGARPRSRARPAAPCDRPRSWAARRRRRRRAPGAARPWPPSPRLGNLRTGRKAPSHVGQKGARRILPGRAQRLGPGREIGGRGLRPSRSGSDPKAPSAPSSARRADTPRRGARGGAHPPSPGRGRTHRRRRAGTGLASWPRRRAPDSTGRAASTDPSQSPPRTHVPARTGKLGRPAGLVAGNQPARRREGHFESSRFRRSGAVRSWQDAWGDAP